MGFARAVNVPVVLIGDIDRGGVIASLVGTKAVIEPDDAALVCGFLVNKFRGDPALFASGMKAIAHATGWQPRGLVPLFPHARPLPARDPLALDRALPAKHARAYASRCRSCRTSPISTTSIRLRPNLPSNSSRSDQARHCRATPTS